MHKALHYPIRLVHGVQRVAGYIRHPKGEFNCDYQGDGLAVKNKNIDWMTEPKFAAAYEAARLANIAGWKRFTGGSVPDIRWRAHTCCWAAQQAMSLPGDFAEFGVHTGILSMTVCHYTDFGKSDKKFFLFDTFNGIPEEQVIPEDREKARHHNEKLFFDCYEIAAANFAPFPNSKLVRGILPDTLADSGLGQLAYVSMDLNNTVAERAVINTIWDRIVPGGIIILDDYGFVGYEAQHAMWDEFAAAKSHPIFSVPTGQGLIVKH